jgi:hypothetical protein
MLRFCGGVDRGRTMARAEKDQDDILEHDPEKWKPVFLATNATRLRGNRAQSKR